MPEMASYPPGAFCWPELVSADMSAARAFYGGMFDWGAEEVPGGSYAIFQKGGKDVAGLRALAPEQIAQGIPPCWVLYVAVASADEAAGQVPDFGGKVIAPPFDVPNIGRMAFIQDPSGGVIALWQAGAHHGAGLVDETGTLCWVELNTRDVDAARPFYKGLFGWSAAEMSMGGSGYTIFSLGEKPVAGMMDMTGKVPAIVPPHWLPYFAVDDCDGSLSRACGHGAQNLAGPMDVPGVGRFAVLKDPQGATFAVIRLG